jgi:hypothetical protein
VASALAALASAFHDLASSITSLFSRVRTSSFSCGGQLRFASYFMNGKNGEKISSSIENAK